MDQEALFDAIETGLLTLPEIPGRLRTLAFPGIRGRITCASNLFANLVGASTLEAELADETIRRVHALFLKEDKEYGWIIGPRSTPPDLASRLQKIGLAKEYELAGMVWTDMETPLPANPSVNIREATVDDLDPASRVLSSALEMPLDSAMVLLGAVLQKKTTAQARLYLAFLEGTRDPVGVADTVYLAGPKIAVLFSAGTLTEYRGRGIYTSLVARRLADARRDGMQAAVVQAVRTSSAPICRKLGFRELTNLDWYAWRPKK